MAISTYAELVTATSDWLDRTDLEGKYPNFLAILEAKINRALRVPQMEASASATTTDSIVALPDDFLSARDIYVSGESMSAMSPQLARDTETRYTLDTPLGYAIIDGAIKLVPAQDDGTEVSMVYYAQLPALTSANTTNWLLSAYPDAYLYGLVAVASDYIRDGDRATSMFGLLESILDEIRKDGTKRNAPSGPLVARGGIIG